MQNKYTFLICSIISFYLLSITFCHSKEDKNLLCKGIYWSNNSAEYAEWTIIKAIPKHKIYFKINNKIKIAKFSIRKGNAGIIIGTGGWFNKTGEKSSLTISYSLTNNIFKMKSRYTDTRVEGKCIGKMIL